MTHLFFNYKSMKKLLLISLVLFISCLSISAQEQILIGNKYSIQSAVLKEKRDYWVYLPPRYDNANYAPTAYPVIYLLDGDTNFNTAVAIQQTYTRGMYNNMPECIIVGIPNTDRARDLTPSQSEFLHNGKPLFKNSGNAENFTQFLTRELRHQIESTYRTNAYNILIGHSFGGLFTVNTLIHHTNSFNAYIALDPSLWWDKRKVYHEAEVAWQKEDLRKRFLFIAMAKNEDKPNDEQLHSTTIDMFCKQVLLSNPSNGLIAGWKYYANEDHGTVILPGIYDALRTLFDGIQLPVKEIPNQPELIEQHYSRLSEKLGFTFTPEEYLVDNIAKYALSIDNKKGARQLFEYNLKLHPSSAHAQQRLQSVTDK